MIQKIKDNMCVECYNTFNTDYNRLVELKENKKLWRSAMSSKSGKVPFLKNFFDNLPNKYNYTMYRNSVQNDRDIFRLVVGLNKSVDNTTEEKECLLLHYTIESYVAFMVEWLLYKDIKENTFSNIYKNNILDTKKKADLLCNGYYYQIKNKSFIYESCKTMDMIKHYKEFNNRLFFIFYSIERDNIYFVAIEDKPFISINDIDGFTFARPYNLISSKDYYKYFE